jgi:ABC-type multidrug transport system permease subunit
VIAARELGGAALGVLRRDWQLFISYRSRLVMTVLSMLFTLTIFYYISRLVRVGSFGSPGDYYAFVVVGLVILQVTMSTLSAPPMALQTELLTGTFERLAISPFGLVASICSMMLFPFLLALGSATVMLAVAWLVFGLPVQWSTAWLGIPVAALAALAFSCFGVMLTGVVLVFKQATMGTTWIVGLISLSAGLYFPIALLPGWARWTSEVQPFTPAVDLLRHVLVGWDLAHAAWLDGLKLAGFALVLMPAAVWCVGYFARVSRARGVILEY